MTRVDLQYKLEEILGSRNVYFQPPSSLQLKYPCIVYTRDSIDQEYSNNSKYFLRKRYPITVIDSNPDSSILDKVLSLPYTSFDRHFVADNMNHDIYSIYIL